MARFIIVEDNHELASLIAATARARGHEVEVVHTGKVALARLEGQRFDGAVVDLLLPDIRGTDVIKALTALRVPAIAVSGVYRGDRFALEATQVHGAAAFLEKPFKMSALLSALEHAAHIEPGQSDLEEASLEELELLPEDEVKGEVPALPAGPAPEVMIRTAEAERVWSKGKPKEAKPALPPWVRSGVLASGSVPRLLNAYYAARHAGELKLKHGNVIKVVYFENGWPVYAASNLAEERFARFCARKGVLPDSELTAVAALAKEGGIRTGEAMIQLGVLTPERRKALLEDQVREIIWSVFRWSEGEYSFSLKKPGNADLVKLSVFPGNLILEGVLHQLPLVDLRQKMPPSRRLFPTPDPPYELHEIKLSGAQARLLAYADGSKSIEDLLALTDLNELEALATLLGLEYLGLIEERREQGARRITFGI